MKSGINDVLRRIVVVGGSLAGVAAVEELRQRGFNGDIVLLGDEAMLPYDRPPLSKAVLAGEQAVDDLLLRPPEWYEEQQIDLLLGLAAVGLDPSTRTIVLADGEHLTYDGLVIATGSAAVMLSGTPSLPGVHTLRTAADSEAIRTRLASARSVVVVGGGFIGAEVAATAVEHGCRVTVLEALPSPMERVIGPEVGAVSAALHRRHGVEVRCSSLVTGLRGSSTIEAVELDDGSRLDADLVVVGVGARPNIGWLQGSGLPLDDGVLCDAYCRAGDEGVVAAGDVARWQHPTLGLIRIEHWENANRQGQAAARSLLGDLEAYGPTPYVWSDQYDRKIQIVGNPAGAEEMVVVDGALEDFKFVSLYGLRGRLVGALSMNRSRPLRAARALLDEGVSFDNAIETFTSTRVSSTSPRQRSGGVTQ